MSIYTDDHPPRNRVLDPNLLDSRWNRCGERIIRFTQSNLIRQHLPVLAVGVVAFSIFRKIWEQLSVESGEASLAVGSLIGIFGAAAYGSICSGTALQFIQSITVVISLVLTRQNSVFCDLEPVALKTLGKGCLLTLAMVDSDSGLGELVGWVSFVTLPFFGSLLGASETSVLQTGLIVTTVVTMISFFGTILKILPFVQGIPFRQNSTPFRI